MTSPKRLAVLLSALPLLLLTAGCGDEKKAEQPAAQQGRCDYQKTGDAAKKADLPPGDLPSGPPAEVTIKTDRGDIPVSLDADKAPCAVNSFLSLVDQGFYDDTECHRLVTKGLHVLQCGDPSGTGSGGPGYQFGDELHENDPRLQPCQGSDPQSGKQVCTYPTGTVAMANAGPDTNGSQFFLVYKDSPLASAYTVFGRMSAAGVKVVQEVAAAGNAADGVAPKQPVTIETVEAPQTPSS